MHAVKRLKKYETEPLDTVLALITKGEIKPGMYSHLVKIDKSKDLSKEKELFTNGQQNHSREQR